LRVTGVWSRDSGLGFGVWGFESRVLTWAWLEVVPGGRVVTRPAIERKKPDFKSQVLILDLETGTLTQEPPYVPAVLPTVVGNTVAPMDSFLFCYSFLARQRFRVSGSDMGVAASRWFQDAALSPVHTAAYRCDLLQCSGLRVEG